MKAPSESLFLYFLSFYYSYLFFNPNVVLMCIPCNSSTRSLKAYAISTISTSSLSHLGHIVLPLIVSSIAIVPHLVQIGRTTLSESYLSFNNSDAPWATNACCSISPSLNAPPRDLPSIGCLVSNAILPRALPCNLLLTIYFNFK